MRAAAIYEKVGKPSSIREARDALRAYERLRGEGVTPSVAVSLAALKACISLRDIQAGKRIHTKLNETGDDHNIFVANTVVDMYAKCGSMGDAQRAFEAIPHHSVVSWNAIIKGYAQRGEGEVALQLFGRMQAKGFKPNAATYIAAIKACTNMAAEGKLLKPDCLEKGKRLHSQLVNSGLESNLCVASSLVDMYAKYGSMGDAKQVFDRILHHDVVLWNTLIAGYVQSGEGEVALQLFARMQDRGFTPNARTFTAAISACSSLAVREAGCSIGNKLVKTASLEKGIAIHSQLAKTGQEADIYLASALVDMYVKCGSMVEARSAFDRMPHHDVVSWTGLIMGYAQSGEGELALKLFSRMQEEGCSPNALTYVAALEACISIVTREGQVEHRPFCLETGMALHSQAARRGYESHSLVVSTLVDMYAKCGRMIEARKVFDKAAQHDLLLWNAIIRGYSQAGEAEAALQLYAQMIEEGFTPVAQTFVCALKACGILADLHSGRRIHSHIRSAGLEQEEMVANSLISFYGRCANMLDARQVFDLLQTKGPVTWNALIAGYSHQGDAREVFSLFQRMQKERLLPSGITFLCILTACSRAGLVDKGKEYFSSMSSDYGVTASIEHYSCMVDLLGRANHLEEALAILKDMPMEPNVTVWRAILGASRKWKNVQIGRLAFDSIVGFDKRDAAAYSVMANIYTAAGMWEEGLEIQMMRQKSRAWKQPGQSWWIDESGAVHRFCAGDKSHPQSDEILGKLKQVVASMKEHGYVPDMEGLLFDVSEHEQQNALCGHSEKLAIGCALINTSPGSTIHIAKNLRACDDCHRATAIISKIEKRVVVCRDANRFHVFRDGVCSCGDFW